MLPLLFANKALRANKATFIRVLGVDEFAKRYSAAITSRQKTTSRLRVQIIEASTTAHHLSHLLVVACVIWLGTFTSGYRLGS